MSQREIARKELDWYEFGIRIKQAVLLCGRGGSDGIGMVKFDLRRAIGRLFLSTSQVPHLGNLQGHLDDHTESIRCYARQWRAAIGRSRQNRIVTSLRLELEMLDEFAISLDAVLSDRASKWLKLGRSIADGSDESWSDGEPYWGSPTTDPEPVTEVVSEETAHLRYPRLQMRNPQPAKWEWSCEEAIHALCSELGVNIGSLFPPISGSDFDCIALNRSLSKLLWGWNAIEIGLNRQRQELHVERPHWDARTKTLFVSDVPVRRFSRAAPKQTIVFDEFEAQGWPERIENPYSTPYEQNQTLRQINQGIEPKCIAFRGDGQCGIRWERLTDASLENG